ncbi:UDP-3-O-[3-hydroxymyristoyl] N-acetylglucosamine deacetylase [Desulfocucumis palustris]|uniref:UDP-3-O-acyl-N-acetylglucosamine deacetylase n=1 Tax=Desulfocucumis palustris TaxID=1898651 RepID=A0A2L2XBU0_9FIRM|nr:UDP-3-O-[3-hydroxymyristoyl] N-acetylglucosamine deacetylase [Desulfocucumis palustris]
MTFKPAPPDSGITFIRDDLPGRPGVECRPEYARADHRWTSLDKEGVRIEHTEHILAAAAGLGIDNLLIHADGPYLPVVTGFSSGGFVQALLEAEPVFQDRPREYFYVPEARWVMGSFDYGGERYDSILLALPSKEFKLTYLMDYPGKQISTQAYSFAVGGDEDFALGPAAARSYIIDYEYARVADLIGRGMEDCLVFPGAATDLRWNNEPARHKLLDLLGDMAILGRAVKGHFIGIRTGHKMNIQMCKELAKLMKGDIPS